MIKVRKVDYSQSYAYAPPDVEAYVNENTITNIEPVETRKIEKCSMLQFQDKESWIVVGTPADIMERMLQEKLNKLKLIDMILFCPHCYHQHIDKPDAEAGWENPPHKSHKCHHCGCIWRPADVPTNGVENIKTRGKDDTFQIGE